MKPIDLSDLAAPTHNFRLTMMEDRKEIALRIEAALDAIDPDRGEIRIFPCNGFTFVNRPQHRNYPHPRDHAHLWCVGRSVSDADILIRNSRIDVLLACVERINRYIADATWVKVG